MDKIMLSQILEKICIEEAAENSAAPMPKLSYRHRRQMKKIFSRYQNDLDTGSKPRVTGVKRIVLVVTIILFAMFTVAAGAAAINGFNQKKHRDYTELLTVNAENCPKTIENVYYLSEIPDGYELYSEEKDDYFIFRLYLNHDTGMRIVFHQEIKDGYRCNFNTEYNEFEEFNINGHYALYLKAGNSENVGGLLVWDNGDYILQISGDLSKDELLNLAKSAKF